MARLSLIAVLIFAFLAPRLLRADEPGKIVGWIDNNDPNRTIHREPYVPPSNNQVQPRPVQPQPQAQPQPQIPLQDDQQEKRHQEAAADNKAGQEALDSQDWATAIEDFQNALAIDPDNALYQQNLQYAREKLAEAQADARRKDQARLENHQGVEAFAQRDWVTALRYFQQAIDRWPDNPVYVKNLQNTQKQVERVQRDASAANDMAAAIAQMVDTLPALGGAQGDVDNGSSKSSANNSQLSFIDADSVVDARKVPSGLPKFVEDSIPHSPSGDRLRKGFECVMEHDWPAARAWFEDALNHDPGNAGIGRLIDLAQYTMRRQKASSLTFEDADAVMSQMFREGPPIGPKVAPEDPELERILDEMFKNMLLEHPGEAFLSAPPTGAAAAVQDPAWQKILELLAAGATSDDSQRTKGKGTHN